MSSVDRYNIDSQLICELKAYVGITWNDDVTDYKFQNIVASSMVYLQEKLGEDTDFNEQTAARELLFERVRYAWASALDVFENNYLSLILAMQNEKKVRDYVEKAKQAEE